MKKLILTSIALMLMSGIFADLITIGTGTSSEDEPICSRFGYHRSAAIYTQAELAGSGTIKSISFQAANTTTNIVPIKVYMTMTTAATLLPVSWPTMISGLSPIYVGNVYGTTAGDWKTLTFNTPFAYIHNNLQVMIESNFGGGGSGSGIAKENWYYSYAYNQNYYRHQDNNPPVTQTGSVNSNRPNIRLNMIGYDSFIPPVLSLDPDVASWSFGETAINTVATKLFTITNSGGGTLNLNTVVVSGGYCRIGAAPDDTQLTPGESTTFTVEYLPFAVAPSHNAVLTINSNVAVRTVALSGSCYDPLSVITTPFFEGFETGNYDQATFIKHWTQAPGPDYTGKKWQPNTSQGSYNRSPRSGDWNVTLEKPGQCYLFRPIELTAGTEYAIELYARQGTIVTTDATIQVSYGNQPTIAGMTASIIPASNLDLGNYQRLYGSFSPATTGRYYIGIQGGISGSPWYISLDDISIYELPSVPILSYSPTAIDFGMVMQGLESDPRNLTITNTGGGILNIATADISIMGPNAARFRFGTDALPASLSSGQAVEIPVFVTPLTTGALSATLRITNTQTRSNYDIPLQASGLPSGIVRIGEGVSNLYLPIDPYYHYSYSQSIFLQSEIATANKRIEKLYYFWNGTTAAVNSNDWTIYMGHTALSAFVGENSWIPLANLSQVFIGEVALPGTAGWIEIPLNTPFQYNNLNNLVIAVDENEAYTDGSAGFFSCTASATSRSMISYAFSDNPDPANPGYGAPESGFPNVMLAMGNVPAGAPKAPILNSPLAATALFHTGFDLRWTPNATSGHIDYYKVYLWTDAQTINTGRVWRTTGTSLNPCNPPLDQLGNPQTALTFNYLDRYNWTVEAYANAYPVQMARAQPSWFQIEANPTVTQFPWSEGFEGAVFPPRGWSIVDADADGESWSRYDHYDAAHTGSYYVASYSWNGSPEGLNPENWLITAPVVIPATGLYVIDYYVGGGDATSAGEHYGFYISTTGTALDDFDCVHSEFLVDDNWAYRVFSLGNYAGQTVHFAFRHGDVNNLFNVKIDDVGIHAVPQTPVFSYSPGTIDFGVVKHGVDTVPRYLTITNNGGGILNISATDLSLMGSHAAQFRFSTGNLPVALSLGQSANIPIFMNASTVGPISATLRIINTQTRTTYDVPLSAKGTSANTVSIGSGTENLDLPINPYFGYSYSQSIFLQSAINTSNQSIDKLYYYWNGAGDASSSNDWSIYMGHTSLTAFANASTWIPLSNLTPVFQGNVPLPAAAGWIEITLTTPFLYNNIDNLMIAVDENEWGYETDVMYFHSTATATNRSIMCRSDMENPDPAAPPIGTLRSGYPNIMLGFSGLQVSNLQIRRLGNFVRLTWDETPGAAWYNIYGSEDPYQGFVSLGWITQTETDIWLSEFPLGKAFFRVAAGQGNYPRGNRLLSPQTKE